MEHPFRGRKVRPFTIEIAALVGAGAGGGAFADLTFPALSPRLADLAAPWFAIGAFSYGAPAGLALGWRSPSDFAQLMSIMVAPSFRGQGLAARLLGEWEKAAARLGATRVCACHSTRTKQGAAFEAALARAGWPAPQLHGLHLIGEAGALAEAVAQWPGVRGRLTDSQISTFDTWTTLTAVDRAAIERLKAESGIRPDIAIQQYEAALDPVCSVIVRRRGEVVGWIFAEPVRQLPIRGYDDRVARFYPVAYIAKSVQHTGIMIAGFWHAYSRQAAAYGCGSLVVYRTSTPGFMQLTRRLAPIAIRVDEIFESIKKL